MKTIWIIDHYSSEPQHDGISRQYDFAKQLSKMGFRIVVIASAFSHFTHTYITEDDCSISKFDTNAYYVYLRTIAYESNNGIKRAVSMFSFMHQVVKYRKAIEKECGAPDVVMGCSVHPLAWIAANRIAKKYNVRFCAEVRDFWPRVWVASDEKSRLDPMVLFFDAVQKWAFNKAEKVIHSMQHGEKYLIGELGVSEEKVFLIGQPMDCERFDKNSENIASLPDHIVNFIEDSFVCTFAGYYMTYEGVYVILEAARILEKKGVPVKFVFVGSGQEQEGMHVYVKKNNLDNVQINDRIPKESVPALLSNSDICVAHLEVEDHKEVYKYGVSKNKVNEYLYSGACTLYGFLHKDDAVATSGGGMMFEPFNANDLANKIQEIYSMSDERRKLFGINGRKYIRENNSVEVLADKLVKALFD